MEQTLPISGYSAALPIQKKLLGYALRLRGFLFTISLLSLLLAAVVIAQAYLLSVILAQVFIQSITPSETMLFLLLLTIAIRALLIWIRERVSHKNAIDIKSSIRKTLIKSILDKGGNPAKRGTTGEQVALITDGVEKLDEYFVKYLPSVIHVAIFPVMLVLFAMYYDLLSGLILLITGPLIVFFMHLIGTHAKNYTQLQWQSLSALSGYFLDVIQGIKTLKIQNAETREAEKVYTASNRFRMTTLNVLKIAFLSGFVLELAASLSVAMVALQVSIRMIEGLMDFQMGMFMLLLAPEYFLPFRQLGANHHAGMESTAAARQIFASEMLVPDVGVIKTQSDSKFAGIKVDFVGTGYTYPGASKPALNNLNCTLLPNTVVAAVGSTGSGKTTFANLLLKFAKPAEGEIFVDGISLNSIDAEIWHKHIAYVSQKPHFFNSSILENLLMANKDAGMETIIEAARLAGIHDAIMGWQNQYHTLISDNASGISAGERQRLAIARAFLKNAPLLVLDEPSSNLDPSSEQWLARATKQLIPGRTTLIIAHRLKTVVQANHILVFDKGQIVEQGNHTHLINLKGIYAGLLAAHLNPDDHV